MITIMTLVRLEARDARTSLLAAACVTAAVLGAVHAFFPLDFAVANAAAYSVWILVALWTLYFAADSFATDCASGRMQTKSLLPVSALALWRAKITFLGLTIGGLSAWAFACEYVLQSVLGTPHSFEHFADVLGSLWTGLPFLGLVAAAGVLSSLIVESALVAMLLATIVGGALAGFGYLLSRGLHLAGVEWSSTHWLLLTATGAVLLMAFGAVAFAHGQRHLGLRSARARVVVATLGALVVTGGLGTATELYRRAVAGLQHPRTRFEAATASPDGRYIALEVESSVPYGVDAPRSVFVLDLETHENEIVAWPGMLIRDPLTGHPAPWDGYRTLRVARFTMRDWRALDEVVSVEATDGGLRVESTDSDTSGPSRLVPSWAEETSAGTGADGSHELRVRWPARGLERSFVGDVSATMLGRGIFLSAHAGRVLALQGGMLRLFDLEDERKDVLATNVTNVCPSPDGSAILVRCEGSTLALATADGSSLHEPWPNELLHVRWIESEGSSRTVLLSQYGRGGRDFVKDLDTGVQFELSIDRGHALLHRLGERGYVFVDREGDLVWVDPHGERIAVLVDR